MRGACVAALVAVLCAACAIAPTAQDADAWPVVAAVDFATADCATRFAFSDPSRWRWSPDGDRPALELLGDSGYRPAVRSPTSIALLRDVEVADFDLDVLVQQTGRDYGHRDLCLFFGFASPTRFLYAHLAPAPDEHAHNVFRVADAPRGNLAPVAARGIDWGDSVWHRVRVERRVAAGTIRVWWDDAPEPVLSASDTTLGWGRVGFGSFDDQGRIARLVLRAPAVRPANGPGDPFAALAATVVPAVPAAPAVPAVPAAPRR